MGAGKPKNGRTGIIIDTIKELTASAGVSINDLIKVTTTKIAALVSTADIGDSTTAFKNLFCEYWKYGTGILQFTSTGLLNLTLGHSGFTSGGAPILRTFSKNTTTTTPASVFSHTISQTNTQVIFKLSYISRDNTTGAQCYEESLFTASRAGSGAVAGSFTNITRNGSQLIDVTMTVSGNDATILFDNSSGTNTTSTIGTCVIYSVSTST